VPSYAVQLNSEWGDRELEYHKLAMELSGPSAELRSIVGCLPHVLHSSWGGKTAKATSERVAHHLARELQVENGLGACDAIARARALSWCSCSF
jgi:hypothetical protein